ncbi:MAG: hypothetical protein KatS3mg028_0159 [Bacteroidia bacterium]|nr:MAG: hypothetical protein KatS3mg028_0159 [Bacteroidia bacterium]
MAGINPVTINKTIIAIDPEGATLEMETTGTPYATASPTANFSATPSSGTITGYFSWNIQCQHIKKDPYAVIFRVSEKATTTNCFSENTLSTYTVLNIRVLAPPPKNLTGTPIGNSIVFKLESQRLCIQFQKSRC